MASLYPQIRTLRLTAFNVEITDYFDRKQQFRIKWVRTGFGEHRAMLQCTCGRGAIRLFAKYGTYACRRCHKAVWLCQTQDSTARKRLTACKLRLQLGGGGLALAFLYWGSAPTMSGIA